MSYLKSRRENVKTMTSKYLSKIPAQRQNRAGLGVHNVFAELCVSVWRGLKPLTADMKYL